MRGVSVGLAALVAASVEAGAVFGPPVAVPSVGRHAMCLDVMGDRLYAGVSEQLVVYDLAQPLAPRKLGRVGGLGNVRQLVARADGLVCLAAREAGLWLVDARDPSAPKVLSRYDCCEFATGVECAGDVVFLGQRQNGIEFIDISDPAHPHHILMRQTPESQSVAYRDGWLYSGEWGAAEVSVFDVHDLRAVRLAGRRPLHGFGDGLDCRGDLLFCSTGHDARHDPRLVGAKGKGRGRGLDIFSIADPAAPRHLARLDFPCMLTRDHDFWTCRAQGDRLYCVDSHNGLFAVDIADPAHPKILDRLVFPEGKPDQPSAACASLAFGDGCLYLAVASSDDRGGIYVIPVEGLRRACRERGKPPAHPEYREDYPTDATRFHVWRTPVPAQARAVVVTGDVAYAACGDAGLHVLGLDHANGIRHLGKLSGPTFVADVKLRDGLLWTAEGMDGFGAYARDGVASFREVGRVKALPGNRLPALCVWTPGKRWAVLSARHAGYWVYDAADPAHPKDPWHPSVPRLLWDKYLCDETCGGELYPMSQPYRGVCWLDLSGTRPELTPVVESVKTTLYNAVCPFGEGRCLVTDAGKYAIVSAREAADSPAWRLKPLPGDFRVNGIPRAKGRYVAVTSRVDRRAAVYDFADVEHPVQLCGYELSGNPDVPAFFGNSLVIPCGHQGVLLEKTRRP